MKSSTGASSILGVWLCLTVAALWFYGRLFAGYRTIFSSSLLASFSSPRVTEISTDGAAGDASLASERYEDATTRESAPPDRAVASAPPRAGPLPFLVPLEAGNARREDAVAPAVPPARLDEDASHHETSFDAGASRDAPAPEVSAFDAQAPWGSTGITAGAWGSTGVGAGEWGSTGITAGEAGSTGVTGGAFGSTGITAGQSGSTGITGSRAP